MRRSIAMTAVFSMFLVATAHAQWTPTNATTNDRIFHANDITVTGNVAVDDATMKPWAAGKVLQGRTGAFFLGRLGDTHMTSNAYYSGVSGEGWNYMSSGWAANMYFYNGDTIFRTAVPGVADAVLSWTYPFQIKNNGSVLVGMGQNAASTYTLDVNGSQHVAGTFNVFKDWNGSAPTNILAGFDAYDDQSRVILRRANGNTGAETQVVTNDIIGALQFRGWHSGGSFAPAASASVSAIAGENFSSTGFGAWLMFNTTPLGATEVLTRMTITPSGQVGIGVVPVNNSPYIFQVVGNADFRGTVTGQNIQAQYQDVAEWVPVDQQVAVGTVVVVATNTTNTVVASVQPYDTRVAGVVSAHPGLILGVESASKARIATTGRVKVRVDASRHPVAIGDLLVTSDKPGMAMLSEPLDLGGVKIHRPGTLIGKALEPLAQGEGEILVLLSLQ